DMGPISRGQSGSLPVRPRAASVRPRPAAVLLGQPVLVRLGERHGVGVTVRCVPLMRVLVQVLEPRGRAELGAVVLLDLPLRAYPRDVPAVELLVERRRRRPPPGEEDPLEGVPALLLARPLLLARHGPERVGER